MNKDINILQLQAKDLVMDGDVGFEIKSEKRFKASLDYSLETIKLEKVHRKVFRNNKFKYLSNSKYYSTDVVSVEFNYRTEDLSTDELREKLYKDGFNIEGNHYVRFKRSGGSARVGKCLFIREEMFKPMMKWSYMGLVYEENQQLDLASLEAYVALTTSSIIDTIEIKPNEILLIDDYKSHFDDTVMVTRINEQDELETNKETVSITNSIWDGQSLLDSSLFEEKYKDRGMLLLRNRFFKSCCFNCNIQEYFKDNNITNIKQLKGKTLAENISDIKMITTPSSIKYLKFGTYENYLIQLESTFGIVKYDKPTHFFEGELVQTHYQLLNTLQFTHEETERFLEDTLEYIRMLKQELPVLRYHLKMKVKEDLEVRSMSTTNDFIYTMLQVNDKIRNTSMFSKFRTDLINAYVLNVRAGHVLINGNYSVLMGNGIEMLKSSIGLFGGNSELGIDEVHSKRFEYNKKLLGVRSPHVTMGNLWLIKNIENKNYDTYFNLSKQILCVNSIGNNMLERLNGADFDSDSILLTDNLVLINKAEQNYSNFLVPTSLVESTKAIRLNNAWHRYDLDKKTSVNIIGEIINMSQILNSILWELIKNGKDYEEVYKDISKLAVMSCIEIDKAKKEFVVDNTEELKKIRVRYADLTKEKPMFFYHLPTDSKLHIEKNVEKHRFYDTTMDYLQKIITKRVRKIRVAKEERLSFVELLVDSNNITQEFTNLKQVNKVIEMCKKMKNNCATIWASEDYSKQEKYFKALEEKENFILELSKMAIYKDTIKRILLNLDSSCQRKMASSLFIAQKSEFIELFKDGIEKIQVIENDINGDILIYGLRFSLKNYNFRQKSL